MTGTVCRGVVRGGVVLLAEGASLREGTEVVVTPVIGAAGSAAAVIAAMEDAPKVPAEWVDELEEAILAGRRPPSPPVTFSEPDQEK
jgi:hypothetical protein